ncbi:MAG: hypothetical protein H6797_01830 [Candidatus Nomurabacteria bacterium]|nr:MAG: hypothetical protein H6797_01830 [Candidatus Nomurabacteria bacterium]
MRLSNERIQELRALLLELHGLDVTDEQAQEAGLSIMRFVLAKAHIQQQLSNDEEIKTSE